MTYTIIIFITILLLFSSIKKKRRSAKYVYKEENEEFDMPLSPIADIEEDKYVSEDSSLENETCEQAFVDTENENLEDISAKNAPYFTYEAPATEDTGSDDNYEKRSQERQENKLQNSENEEERTSVDLNNPEELKKAIIYKEILQNPYI